VLSDSGTISEESAILGFPAVTLRDSIERPEAVDTGSIVLAGVSPKAVMEAVKITLLQFEESGAPTVPLDYMVTDVSRRVLNFITSTVPTHSHRAGLHRS
jgi:UDP-N-acetylglucosamine 2-epimerase